MEAYAIAWGIAAATMTGQSLGNHDIPRARRAGHEAALQCSLLAGLISLFFVLGSEQIYQFMHTDPGVWETGIFPFRFAGFFQIPLEEVLMQLLINFPLPRERINKCYDSVEVLN